MFSSPTEFQTQAIEIILILGTLIPLIGGVLVLTIQQLGKANDAWRVVMANKTTLEKTIIPSIDALRQDSTAKHAEILAVVKDISNGNNTTTTGVS